ncbi:MAG: class I SAM-dependent methyltransferase [Chloroflexi bacterium]|nr:class I SAM-dependent methyltransferase [Chloroflexota bacterium]
MNHPLPPCRACGGSHLAPILSLGRTPLANSLLTAAQLAQPEPTYPLDLAFCPACTLLQITETVPPELLFRTYLYYSSFSDTMLQSAQQLAGRLITERRLRQESLVVEVASNDGYLLQYYRQAGIPVLGIEPAVNIAEIAAQRGIPTVCEFFGAELAQQLRTAGRQADVIHANNVLAHVAQLNSFVAGFATLLKDDGLAVIETPYVKEMLDGTEFDTIYHEHLCYYSLTALHRLFRRHGLQIVDVERIPLHGGSLRICAGLNGRAAARPAVTALLAAETGWGVNQIACYREFGARIAQLRSRLLELLQELKRQGRRIAVYGASAKGSTLLNYFGIGRETLEYVVDRSTVKQGLYTPGTHLPIYAPEKLLADMPDYVLLLTWNLADEILAQQAAYRARGGRFIVPIPDLRII